MTMAIPTLEQVKSRLAQLSAEPFSEIVYRSSTPRYANQSDLLTGEGSKQHGGRWNPVGIAVIYASLTPETAMAETLAHNRYYGIEIEEAMPRTFVAIHANLNAILDFRRGDLRQRIQISRERMLTVDWRTENQAHREAITQIIGRAAAEIGWEGLIVPSSAESTGHNLLIFPQNLQPESEIQVRNPERLSLE